MNPTNGSSELQLKQPYFLGEKYHSILTVWGHEFRSAYGELDSVTAQVPHVPLVALTASATPSTIDDISKSLCMRHPVHIIASPNRPNIYYSYTEKGIFLR